MASTFDAGIGSRASIGMIALATDRIGVWDAEQFLGGVPGVALFDTRIPMEPVGTPETLRALGAHLTSAASVIVPGSRLDSIGLSCTSGTVAIGLDNVHAAIGKARPGVKVSTPIEAGAKALGLFGATRISLLTPYRVETSELIAGYFEASGFTIDSLGTFGLDGDPQMNGLSPDAIAEAAISIMNPASQALFISCTGLRTSHLVPRIEAALGKPVVTSNQALAWDLLRLAGVKDPVSGQGKLFDAF
jgi:maleate isomerase